MAGRFDGKVALVLGGGADGPPRSGERVAMGNGRAIALRLAEEGARVAVTDLNEERAQATVDVLSGDGVAIGADLGDPEACRSAVAECLESLGRVDIVIANAAVAARTPLRAQDLASWQQDVDVNVRGHWVTAQAALEPMLERGSGGFVFVSSTAGMLSSGADLAYEATKAAQLAVMRHIAVRYAARGIRSNAVVLGIIDSTMVRRVFGEADERAHARASICPMGRQGTPEEAAAAAAFLASEDASYVNGQSLVVDGGVSASWPSPPRPSSLEEEPSQ